MGRRKLFIGKKGDVFFTLLLCSIVLAFIIVVYIYASDQAEKYKDMRIGQSQLQIFKTYEKGENILFFLDDASKLSIQNATMTLAENAGLSEDDVDNLIGAPLWYYNGEDLRPRDYKDNFIDTYDDELATQLLYVNYFTNVNFNIVLKQSSPIYLVGIGESSIRLPLDNNMISQSYENIDYVVPQGAQAQAQLVKSTYYDKITNAIATLKVDVPPELVMAYIMQESKGDPNAVSPTGCIGLMQICKGSQYPDIIKTITLCACSGNSCKLDGSRSCHVSNDDRFNVDKNIESGVWLISQKMASFQKYKDKIKFTMAAYNGGQGVVLDAIKKTGQSDPSWNEVSTMITPDLIFKNMPNTFPTLNEQNQKVTEIRNYVPKVYAYYNLFISDTQISLASQD